MFSNQQLDFNLSQQDLQKKLKMGKKKTFLCPKWTLNRDFALAGEINHDKKIVLCNIFDLNLKILSYLGIL